MAKVKPNPYPGYKPAGSSESPRPVSRVKPEAEEFANQARGSLKLTSAPKSSRSPRPEPKCQGDAAKRNYENGQGSVGKLFGGRPTPRLDLSFTNNVPRVKPEAESIAGAHSGQNAAILFHKQGKLSRSPPPAPRIKPEAEDSAEKHKGGRMNGLIHSPKKLPESPKAVPRVKPDAEKTAELGAGVRMKKYIHKYATPLSARAVPRVKPEATDIAKSHEGRQTATNLSKYGLQTPSARPVPRIKSEAECGAEKHKGGRMNCLLHSPNRLPSSARAVPRVKDEALDNAELNKGGNMGRLFYDYGNQPSFRPKSRITSASEDNARKAQGTMSVLLNSYEHLPEYDQPVPRVTDAGQDIAQKSKGGRMAWILHAGKRG